MSQVLADRDSLIVTAAAAVSDSTAAVPEPEWDGAQAAVEVGTADGGLQTAEGLAAAPPPAADQQQGTDLAEPLSQVKVKLLASMPPWKAPFSDRGCNTQQKMMPPCCRRTRLSEYRRFCAAVHRASRPVP